MLSIEAGLGKERGRDPVGTAEARSRHGTGGNQEAKKVSHLLELLKQNQFPSQKLRS